MSGAKARPTLDDILEPPAPKRPPPAPPLAARKLIPAARQSQGKGGRPMGGSKLQSLLAKPVSFLDVPPSREDVAHFKLSDIDWEFVRHYLLSGMNASEACRRAKPQLSPKSVGTKGARWKKKKRVADAIRYLLDARAQDIEFQAQDVFRELIGFNCANVFDYFNVDDDGHMTLKDTENLTDQQKRNVKKVKVTTTSHTEGEGKAARVIDKETVELEIYDRQENTRDIARILGLFKDKLQLDVGPNLAAILRERAQKRGITFNNEGQPE